MEFKPGTPLPEGTHRNPVRWHMRLADSLLTVAPLPTITAQFFSALWGDDKTSRRIKTWGHQDGKLSAHWLCVRGGTPLHTDPGYARYSVHLEITNQGYFTHGLDIMEDHPVYEPGLCTILDTWSPHQVSRDPRVFQTGFNKLALAIDYTDYPADPMVGVAALARYLNTFNGPNAQDRILAAV